MINTPIQFKKPVKEEKPEYVPSFRPELKLNRAPDESDGTQMYTIYDPLTGKYFKISWVEALIIHECTPDITYGDLTRNVNKKSTAQLSVEDVKDFFAEAAFSNLLIRSRTSEELAKEAVDAEPNPFSWLLIHYLYLRVPLVNLNRFLDQTLPLLRPFISRTALFLYIIVALSGFLKLIPRIDEYLHTFTYFFNPEGFVAYALAITLVKVVHELSHAYTAKYYGVSVPNVGVAFIVMWPVLYTDVTDGWKLSNRFQRLAISAAGIVAELLLAGLATWGWLLTPPGVLQSAFFVVSSSTWVSTLLVNLNPLMRFDGYYMLGDLWGIDNLQTRAFALARWKWHSALLGMKILPPEQVSPSRERAMIIYALCTWIYRFSLYIFVAIFVYLHFTKLLGVFLFAVEIGVFIIWPVVWEAGELYKMRQFLTWNARSIATFTVITLCLLWVILPMPHTKYFPSITVPTKNQVIYVPQDGQVKQIYVKRGQSVAEGAPVIQLYSRQIEAEIQKYKGEADRFKRAMMVAGLNSNTHGEISENKIRLAQANDQLEELYAMQSTLTLKADISGTVYYLMDPLSVNQTLKTDTVIAKIADLRDIQVICYVPENDLEFVEIGAAVKIRLKDEITEVTGKIVKINQHKEDVLEYGQLGSTNKGDLPVNKDAKNTLHLIESYYAVLITLDPHPDTPLGVGASGYVIYKGPWESLAVHYLKIAGKYFWRESAL